MPFDTSSVMTENDLLMFALLIFGIDERNNEVAHGFVKLPMSEPAQKIGAMPENMPIVPICSTGARSGEAYDTTMLLRTDLNAYFLDAKVSYGGDGTFSIVRRRLGRSARRQAARFFRVDRGSRRSRSPRSGFFRSSCAAMRLHTLRQISTIAGSAAR